MPKQRPPYLPGHYYHFYNRGRSRLSIFHERSDYVFLLRHLKTYLELLELTAVSYCLLPNHYHFLVRQDGATAAGLLMQRLFNRYAKHYNHKYTHSGTIFEGDYKVQPVHNPNYLVHLCRYIHANPVTHGIVPHIEQWHYSNYPEWVGVRDGTLVDRTFIHDYFGSTCEYEAFVAEYVAYRRLPDELTYLGEW
jgi:REP element-mobilizing transposase RayT